MLGATVTGQEAYKVCSPQLGPGTSTAVPRKYVLPAPIPVPAAWQTGSTVATEVLSLEKSHVHSQPVCRVPSHMLALTARSLPLKESGAR